MAAHLLQIILQSAATFQPGRAPHIIIVAVPPTVPGWNLTPGPLSFEASALPTELTRLDYKHYQKINLLLQTSTSICVESSCYISNQ